VSANCRQRLSADSEPVLQAINEDTKGHPVFSDQPSTGAEPVDISPANTADTVEVEGLEPEPAASPQPTVAPPAGSREYEEKIEREMKAYRREQAQQEQERQDTRRHEEWSTMTVSYFKK
jgi:hypothetical protein